MRSLAGRASIGVVAVSVVVIAALAWLLYAQLATRVAAEHAASEGLLAEIAVLVWVFGGATCVLVGVLATWQIHRRADSDPSPGGRARRARRRDRSHAGYRARTQRAAPLRASNQCAAAGKLHIVVQNLLANAVSYTERDGSSGVEASARDLLSVWDSGPQLDDAALDRVFDRLWRADAARTDATEHAGLGLSLARALGRHMRMELAAENVDDGGLRFVLRRAA